MNSIENNVITQAGGIGAAMAQSYGDNKMMQAQMMQNQGMYGNGMMGMEGGMMGPNGMMMGQQGMPGQQEGMVNSPEGGIDAAAASAAAGAIDEDEAVGRSTVKPGEEDDAKKNDDGKK